MVSLAIAGMYRNEIAHKLHCRTVHKHAAIVLQCTLSFTAARAARLHAIYKACSGTASRQAHVALSSSTGGQTWGACTWGAACAAGNSDGEGIGSGRTWLENRVWKA